LLVCTRITRIIKRILRILDVKVFLLKFNFRKLKLEDYLRTRFASLMYPAAQAFVLNPFVRRVLFCVPFWVICIYLSLYPFSGYFYFSGNIPYTNADFFYETNFKTLFSPDEIDTGFPSIDGIYLALCWKVFGNSLIINHLYLLPFRFIIIWQAMRLGEKVLGSFKAPLLVLAIIFSPILIEPNYLLLPQILWLTFFLVALNQIYPLQDSIKRSSTLNILMLSCLYITGFEGVIAVLILLLFEFLSIYVLGKSNPLSILSIFKLLKPYLSSSLLLIAFLIFHYLNKGWITSYNNMPMYYFEMLLGQKVGLIKPLQGVSYAIVGLILGYCFLKIKPKKLLPNTRLVLLLLVITISIHWLSLFYTIEGLYPSVFYANYLIISLLCLKLISDLKSSKIQMMLYLCLIIALIMSHF
jgi:hypothetical protein